jgi:hypothetical protein
MGELAVAVEIGHTVARNVHHEQRIGTEASDPFEGRELTGAPSLTTAAVCQLAFGVVEA